MVGVVYVVRLALHDIIMIKLCFSLFFVIAHVYSFNENIALQYVCGKVVTLQNSIELRRKDIRT